jgi:hypothetical protein
MPDFPLLLVLFFLSIPIPATVLIPVIEASLEIKQASVIIEHLSFAINS